MIKDNELRIASFISGTGSTMEHIVIETQKGVLKGEVKVVVVIADRPAPGIPKATAHGVPTYLLDKGQFTSSEQMGEKIIRICKEKRVDAILLNGYRSRLSSNVVEEYSGRVFNQHPAPLDPDNRDKNGEPLHFGGKGMYDFAVHAAVLIFQGLAGRVFPTEATIHLVSSDYDEGGVVLRKEVLVCDGDTPWILSGRVLPVEHQAQVDFLESLYDGRVEVRVRRENLIRKGEERILYEAKEKAVNMYEKK